MPTLSDKRNSAVEELTLSKFAIVTEVGKFGKVKTFLQSGSLEDPILLFIGENRDADALDTDSTWRVWRVTKLGKERTTEGKKNTDGLITFDQIWDDRDTLFPVPVFDNVLSTLYDGINDKINFGNVFNFDISNQFSISGWIRLDNLAARRQIFAKTTDDSNVHGYSAAVETSGAIFIQMRAPGGLRSYTTAAGLISASVYAHVVVTYAGGSNINGVRVYVDNVVAATPASGSFSSSWLSGQNFLLGCRNLVSNTFPFSGYMDEVSIWSKALSAGEVSTLYNTGSPNDPRQQTFVADLLSYYPMGDGDTAGTVLDNHNSTNGAMVNFGSDPFKTVVP